MTEEALFELLSLECRVHSSGTMTYHNSDGQLHREHGPAVEYSDGGSEWYQNGQLHRVDGPAIDRVDIGKFLYKHGRLHSLDGPAIEYTDGHRAWFINGIELTEAEWQQAVASVENV